MTTKQKTVSDLALSLGFNSIVPANNDGEDFRDLAIWTVVTALDAAYEAGRTAAEADHPAGVLQIKSDAMTMALRLYGESDDSFAPETREVMARWRPKVEAILRGDALPVAAAANSNVLLAMNRLLASGGDLAKATEDELTEASNDTEADPIVREQAAAILQARAAVWAAQQDPSVRYTVKEVPVMSGDPMFQIFDSLNGVAIGRMQFWRGELEKIATRLNLQDAA